MWKTALGHQATRGYILGGFKDSKRPPGTGTQEYQASWSGLFVHPRRVLSIPLLFLRSSCIYSTGALLKDELRYEKQKEI